jgi:hypothetical protein
MTGTKVIADYAYYYCLVLIVNCLLRN